MINTFAMRVVLLASIVGIALGSDIVFTVKFGQCLGGIVKHSSLTIARMKDDSNEVEEEYFKHTIPFYFRNYQMRFAKRDFPIKIKTYVNGKEVSVGFADWVDWKKVNNLVMKDYSTPEQCAGTNFIGVVGQFEGWSGNTANLSVFFKCAEIKKIKKSDRIGTVDEAEIKKIEKSDRIGTVDLIDEEELVTIKEAIEEVVKKAIKGDLTEFTKKMAVLKDKIFALELSSNYIVSSLCPLKNSENIEKYSQNYFKDLKEHNRKLKSDIENLKLENEVFNFIEQEIMGLNKSKMELEKIKGIFFAKIKVIRHEIKEVIWNRVFAMIIESDEFQSIEEFIESKINELRNLKQERDAKVLKFESNYEKWESIIEKYIELFKDENSKNNKLLNIDIDVLREKMIKVTQTIGEEKFNEIKNEITIHVLKITTENEKTNEIFIDKIYEDFKKEMNKVDEIIEHIDQSKMEILNEICPLKNPNLLININSQNFIDVREKNGKLIQFLNKDDLLEKSIQVLYDMKSFLENKKKIYLEILMNINSKYDKIDNGFIHDIMLNEIINNEEFRNLIIFEDQKAFTIEMIDMKLVELQNFIHESRNDLKLYERVIENFQFLINRIENRKEEEDEILNPEFKQPPDNEFRGCSGCRPEFKKGAKERLLKIKRSERSETERR